MSKGWPQVIAQLLLDSGREQRVGLRAMKCVVNAQKLLEWLVVEGDITSREKGVALGQELFATGIIRHGRFSLTRTMLMISVVCPSLCYVQ